MSQKGLKIFIFSLLLIFYGSFLVTKMDLPAALDLPRQMQNGKDILQGNFDVITKNVYSYTEPNQSFANHHWLSGVVFYILYQVVGWDGMTIFKIIILLAAFSLLFWIALKKNDFWLVALFSIPTIIILIGRTALRPEIFSYFFVVLFLYLLLDFQENPSHKRVFLLIPLQFLWVNMHLFFGIGILMVAGFLAEKIILNYKELKTNWPIRKLALILILMVATLFINPFGLKGALYSFQVNSSKDFPIASAEINSISNVLKSEPGWGNISAAIFLPLGILLVLSFIVVLIFRWRKKPFGVAQGWQHLFSHNFIFYLAASFGAGGLAYFVIRGIPLFGLIFLPAVCSNLHKPFLALKQWIQNKFPDSKKIINIACIIILIGVVVWFTILGQEKIMKTSEQGLGLDRFSQGSATFFKDNNLRGPIFNDTDIGSYLIGQLYPKEKVFTDNRFGDAYSAHFFADIYLPMLRDDQKWQEGVEKYHLNAIFFYHYDQVDGARDFLYRRFYDKSWALVYADSFALIFVKNTKENQDIINKFQITRDNIAEKLKYLFDSKDPEEQLAAADIFNLIGRIDLSMPAYLKYVSLRPERGKVWMVLGRTELTKSDQQNSNPYVAAIYLERAIKEDWKTWESYSYLALAYFRTGQIDRAKAAVKEELKIDPENKDGEKWLGVLANQAK